MAKPISDRVVLPERKYDAARDLNKDVFVTG
jgi:hypothetical protein